VAFGEIVRDPLRRAETIFSHAPKAIAAPDREMLRGMMASSGQGSAWLGKLSTGQMAIAFALFAGKWRQSCGIS
jgi:hypothetical protein